MTLLDRMIATYRLEEFVDEFVRIYNDEQEDKTLWEVWLHRIFDKSFAEFKISLTKPEKAAPTPEELRSIAQDSMNILAGFAPMKGCVQDGNLQAAWHDCG
jgi:hypothetical protein